MEKAELGETISSLTSPEDDGNVAFLSRSKRLEGLDQSGEGFPCSFFRACSSRCAVGKGGPCDRSRERTDGSVEGRVLAERGADRRPDSTTFSRNGSQ
jgi:hypothetical protein